MKTETQNRAIGWNAQAENDGRGMRHRLVCVRSPHRSTVNDASFMGPSKRTLSIRIGRRIDASAERTFHAWLDPDVAGKWLFATAARPMARVDIDARAGRGFRFIDRRDGETFDYRGTYTAIVPHRHVAFTLWTPDDPYAVTRVTVDIAAHRNGCAVVLAHEAVSFDRAVTTRQRWTGILYGLAATLASP
jgi:uncharacterized protein YndB with AHSA1/START domain